MREQALTLITLITFLEELTLKSSAEVADEQNSLRLMTIHNGKGLEFSLVFISGLEEDLFPHFNCKANTESLEEERRLCYVGITRAKEKVYFSYARRRLYFGSRSSNAVSRFLGDIDESLLEMIGVKQLIKNYGDFNSLSDDFDDIIKIDDY